MGTTQSAVAHLESGRHRPSWRSLDGYARATGTRPVVKLVAARPSRRARWRHRCYAAEAVAERQEVREAVRALRALSAAGTRW